ncbi:RNA-directed DNA polymerase from mobile element jockey [Caerostris extrusa]|uniref:RNA-directed DNA polymerase from mobile element jockey n=1 Tax=Caerostris extrusa TaxID=172846 RepID=A0AAV4YB97_CAEEX|nr:RNA-directed DNA polymerase from mobile element jockey [Caerostris extrusa]
MFFHNNNNNRVINLHSLRVGFWNAAGIRRQLEEVKEFVSDHDLDLFLIQETFLQPGFRAEIPNFTLYRNDRVNITTLRAGGGTCIYVKNALVHHQIPTPTLTSTEATILNLKITEKNSIVFISIYCIVGRGTPFEDLKKLQKIHSNVIFAGDFNATHTSWNNSKNNQRGVQLNKFLNENNHRIIAPTSATRIDPRYNAQNIIDFATFKNIPYPATAAVFQELSSDHLPCLLEINLNVKPQTIPNLFITNWDDYNFNLQRTNLKLTTINNEEDADNAIENFTKDLYAALNNSSKPKYLNIKGRLPKEINLMIKNKNYLRRLYQRSRDPTIKEAYKN